VGAGVIALLGSGETAPGMTKVHRDLLHRLNPVRAVNLDSAFGFQLNVPQMTEKLVAYFATSLTTTLAPLSLPSYDDASPVQRAIFKEGVRSANYVFAGPGSPSWALAQWSPLGLTDDLLAVASAGGVLCFASAAALTLGSHTAPVYEIYKVGVPKPYWLEGLDVMGRIGLACAVIPHFDNREGANYDTRYCYLGEPRLLDLEAQLPDGVAVLGIDEHTALIIDLEARSLTVRGRGSAYWRVRGDVRVLEKGTAIPMDTLSAQPMTDEATSLTPAVQHPVDELEALAERASGSGADALDAIAQLTRRAVGGGEGRIDPSTLVESLLKLRDDARQGGQYEIADGIRAALGDAGIEVNDGPDGSRWVLR
jgi:hypothetical protein